MAQISTNHDSRPWVHYQAAVKAARLLTQAGFDAYLIGGAVRDILTGRLPKDFDLVTNAKPEQIRQIAGLEDAKYQDPAQAFGVSRLNIKVEVRSQVYTSMVEVATYRRDIEAHLGRKQTKITFTDLAGDIRRRDFTINALALDLANDYLVDLVGGLGDLEAGVVRFIGQPNQRITEDPLRILRGVRLKVQYGFNYEPATLEALRTAITSGVVQDIATERIRDELTRMLTHHSRRLAIEELANLGVISQILPELAQTKGVDQPKQFHAEGDVWTHTLLAIDNLPPVAGTRLVWATLLHDIGKPPTFASAEATGDRIRFSEHYKVGAELAAQRLASLKFSKRLTAEISWMINNHMGIDDLPKMRPARAQHFMAHPAFADLLKLHRADAMASWRLTARGVPEATSPDFSRLEHIYQDFLSSQDQSLPSLKRDLGIDGRWLKKEFKLTDGPLLGKVLTALQEAYLDEQISDRQAARRLAEQIIAS